MRFIAALLLVMFSISILCAAPRELMLAKSWQPNINPTGWWMSEKLDGVRGYWDGEQMWSRQGNRIDIPNTLRQQLPPFPTDGELWAGRNVFEQTNQIVRRDSSDESWQKISYLIFDAPNIDAPFEERMAALQAWYRVPQPSQVRIVEQTLCTSATHLRQTLRIFEAKMAEGLMLRAPRSAYHAGRSDALLKVKSYSDAEGVVIGYRPGKGKYTGMTGAVIVRHADGTELALGSGLTDAERKNPPAIGTLVTFKYRGYTNTGKPRFATYWRVRE